MQYFIINVVHRINKHTKAYVALHADTGVPRIC